MIKDKRALEMNGIDAAGAEQFERILEDTLTFLPSAMSDLEQLLLRYPDFMMGWIFKAYSHASDGRRSTLPIVAKMVTQLDQFAPSATKREALHMHALKQWSQSNLKGALDTWQHILSLWPLDIIAYRQFTGQTFWFGQKQRALQVSLQVLPYWDEQTPGYWMFAAAHAFALEEAGEYELAEAFARQTLGLNHQDLIAKHTMAHIFEMQGEAKEGIEFLQGHASTFANHNAFRGHLWWHLALFHLEEGNIDDALALFDQHIYPAESSIYLDIQNAASLLARLEFMGADVGERWHRLSAGALEISADSTIMFTEIHNAMVLAKTDHHDQLDANITQIISSPLQTQEVEFMTGSKLMQAIKAYHSSNYRHCIELINQVRDVHSKLGGSHAQQDVISQYLLMAHAHLQQWDQVACLLKNRYIARAQPLPAEQIKRKLAQFDEVKNIDALLPSLVKVI